MSQNSRTFHLWLCGLSLAVLAGCAAGPNYHRPSSLAAQPAPAAFTVDGVEWTSAQPAAGAPKGQWWTVFADPDLDRLEQSAAEANLSLAPFKIGGTRHAMGCRVDIGNGKLCPASP